MATTIDVNRVTNLVSTSSLSYMRALDVVYTATDCKPNARMYAVFDGQVVNQFIVPNTGPDKGILGGRIFADKDGNSVGTFKIPRNTFNTGVKSFTLTENPDPLAEPLNGSLYGYAVADFQSTGVKQIYQSTITIANPTPPPTRWVDPLAQSIFTDGVKGGVFITVIGLFFNTKDATIPVTVEIREMINGYPGPGLANPNAKASLAPEYITTSMDGLAETKFVFPNPIYLEEDKDYCFVVLSNSNNYNIFTCVLGEKSFETDKTVFEQPYLGSLFKSQNNQTWTAEQYEDIKFTMYRAKFDTSSTATISMSASSPPTWIETTCISTKAGSNVIRAELTFDHNLELGSKVGIYFEDNGVWNGLPSNKISGVFNVTAVLGRRAFEFVITQNATVTGKVVHGGFVQDVYIDNQGSDFDPLNPPTITFADPPAGVTATGVPVIVDGKLTQIKITHKGSGYVDSPLITIAGSVGSGASARASLNTKATIIVNRSYSMVTPGIPNLVWSNTKLETFYDFTKGNYEGGNITSYTPGTTTQLNLSTKNWLSENAWLCSRMNEKALLSNNRSSKFTMVMSSEVDNLSPVISVNSIQAMFSGNLINNQDGEDLFAEDGSSYIESITLVNPGVGYSAPPTITFVNRYGCPGEGATATATVAGGTITSITITDPGSGYLLPPFIVFTGASTIQATATVEMAAFNSELRPESGTARSRYISNITRLANSAESARVFVEAYSGHQSNFEVYIRTSLKASGVIHTEQPWTMMLCDVTTNQSSKDQEFLEYEFYLNNVPKYDTADIKIVFRASQPIDVPAIENYRAILTA